MEGLPLDVAQFIERRFPDQDQQAVYRILNSPSISSDRIIRAVLYLSDGSRSMLAHYVREADKDVREVISRAEYIHDIANEPMHVRDMTLPFSHPKNLGGDYDKRSNGNLVGVAWQQAEPKPKLK